jgi:hypothetical protein
MERMQLGVRRSILWYTVSDSEDERQVERAQRGTLHVLLFLMHGHPRGSEE